MYVCLLNENGKPVLVITDFEFYTRLGPIWVLKAQKRENPFMHDFRESFASRAFKFETWFVSILL